MIKVIFKLIDEGNLKKINFEISGHATTNFSDEKGKLVCAAVSGIVFGIMNSLNQEKNLIKKLENKIVIDFLYDDFESFLLAKTLFISLKTVNDDNNNYLSIKSNLPKF